MSKQLRLMLKNDHILRLSSDYYSSNELKPFAKSCLDTSKANIRMYSHKRNQ